MIIMSDPDRTNISRDRFEQLLDALHARSEGQVPDMPESIGERLEPIYTLLTAITKTDQAWAEIKKGKNNAPK